MKRIFPERILSRNEISKRYRLRHPKKVREYLYKYRLENPKKIAEIQRRSILKYPERRMLDLARRRAKAKGLKFSITQKNIVIPKLCPVLGIPLKACARGFSDNSPTLDRLDNKKGYTPENTLVVSWRANRLKCDATLKELQQIYEFYLTIGIK